MINTIACKKLLVKFEKVEKCYVTFLHTCGSYHPNERLEKI